MKLKTKFTYLNNSKRLNPRFRIKNMIKQKKLIKIMGKIKKYQVIF